MTTNHISVSETQVSPKGMTNKAKPAASISEKDPLEATPLVEQAKVISSSALHESTSGKTDKPESIAGKPVDTEALTEAMTKVKEKLDDGQRQLSFELAETENRVIITVIDKETEEVIRQIPPEEMFQLAERLNQDASGSVDGWLFDHKV